MIVPNKIPRYFKFNRTATTIDFDNALGASESPLATGFTGVPYDSLDAIHLHDPLRPSFLRGVAYYPDMDSVWVRAARTGATVIIGFDGTIPDVDTTGSFQLSPNLPLC